MTELEREVLASVRAHGPISGRGVAADVQRRRLDVMRALRALEGRGTVRWTRKGFEVVPGGSRRGSGASTRQSRPSQSIYLGNAELAELVAALEALDPAPKVTGRLRRALERRKARAA